MSYQDKELQCVQCQKMFTFTAGEQEFYDQKGLTSAPKRCKPCRKAKRQQQKSANDGIYRSPAFENSAPRHQRIRGRRGQPRRRGTDRGRPVSPHAGDYRSPAFRDIDVIRPDQEYRAPGFQEYSSIDAKEEYRSPGFQEYASVNPNEEYRSPGLQDLQQKYRDEKPMFEIVCASCGETAKVPFLPEEKERPLCQECYRAEREQERAEQEQAEQEQAEREAAERERQTESTAAEQHPAIDPSEATTTPAEDIAAESGSLAEPAEIDPADKEQ